jgi:hypothetical protein
MPDQLRWSIGLFSHFFRDSAVVEATLAVALNLGLVLISGVGVIF